MGDKNSSIRKKKWFAQRFKIAKESGISLNEEKLIAQFIIDQDSTRRTAKEILRVYELINHIKRIEGEVIDPDLYDELIKNNKKVEQGA